MTRRVTYGARALAVLAAVGLGAAVAGVACGRGGTRVMIQNKGSDTIVNLAQVWAEEYRKVAPTVAVAVSGGGSGTGIAALINGTVDIANASRELKRDEAEAARANTGKAPIEHTVAFDALAIFVHPSNPIRSISRQQLACVFGAKGTCRRWSDLGVTVPGCADQEIIRVSRQNNSGTYSYFREWVLHDQDDLALGSMDMQGSKDVVDLVGHTPCALGYSGFGYATPQVRTLCLSSEEGEPCVAPSVETAADRRYPLSRGLYMYTLGEPEGELLAYLRWIRSDAGQAIVPQVGFAPLPREQREPAPRETTPGQETP